MENNCEVLFLSLKTNLLSKPGTYYFSVVQHASTYVTFIKTMLENIQRKHHGTLTRGLPPNIFNTFQNVNYLASVHCASGKSSR